MDIFEELVMQYFAKDPFVFLSPQYSIKDAAGKEWSCPDFVVLNFKDRTASVVEVTTRSTAGDFASKIQDPEKQWFEKLRNQLVRNGVVTEHWHFRVEIFVRREVREKLSVVLGKRADIRLNSLEDLGFPWQWQWEST